VKLYYLHPHLLRSVLIVLALFALVALVVRGCGK
jgi:hypothetical protein